MKQGKLISGEYLKHGGRFITKAIRELWERDNRAAVVQSKLFTPPQPPPTPNRLYTGCTIMCTLGLKLQHYCLMAPNQIKHLKGSAIKVM